MFCKDCLEKYTKEGDKKVPSLKLPQTPQKKPNLKDSQLTSFFKQAKMAADSNVIEMTPTSSQLYEKFFSQDMLKKSNRKKSVSLTRKRATWKLPGPYPDPITELEVRESFKRAFFVKDMTYSHKQVYDDPDCPEELNDARLEPVV